MKLRRLGILKCCLPMILLFSFSALKGEGKRDTSIYISTRLVIIHFPEQQLKGTILMLPGWNFSANKTCENSTFCTKALKQGYVLVCPEMGKSLYASVVFEQSRKDWSAFPQIKFVTDTLLPWLQEKTGLFKDSTQNFVYGISTGARGGALILEQAGKLFRAGALLSGDYDQCLDLKDNLMNGYYGAYSLFKDRWEGNDNPVKQVVKLKTPVYIGHGKKDVVVSPLQSEKFAALLKKQGTTIVFSYKENQGHNYAYWESETDEVLKFFGEMRHK